MELVKKTYKKIKKYIAIKNGLSKQDSMTEATIERNGNRPVIWLLGTEDYGNLGDHKIAIAIRHFFERYFKEYDVIEISARNYFQCRSAVEQMICSEDIIVGTGGGNFGNQYPGSQQIRMDYIKHFPNNKIIIMPQTIWYTPDKEGDKNLAADVKLCEKHEKLLLVAREKKSMKFAEEHFKNKVVLAPDMVLFEKPYKGNRTRTNKVVFCLRSDLEGLFNKKEKERIIRKIGKNFKVKQRIDTQKDYLISTANREKEVNHVLAEMATADLVVTDRLHGMVFAALAEVPCIAFDNYNGKVEGIYEWIKELPYITYKGTDLDIEQDIQELFKQKREYAPKRISEQFEKLAAIIRDF